MPGPAREVLLVAIRGYEDFADRLAATLAVHRGTIERSIFPDGERYLRVHGRVADRNVILLGGTYDDAAFLDLYEAGCNIAASGARSLYLVVPYFGYGTMERASRPGEVVTAKTRARALSAIPRTQTGNQIALVDLHTEGIVHYFSDQIISNALSARRILKDLILALGFDDPVVAATDAGRAKWVVDLANELGFQAAFVYKRRVGERLEVTGVNADVGGRPVIIYDDMIRTGGSLLQAAQAYLEQGAAEVHAVTTHLVLAGGGLSRILGSQLIRSVSGTDTHPNCRLLKEAGGRVATVVPLIREAILSRYPYLVD